MKKVMNVARLYWLEGIFLSMLLLGFASSISQLTTYDPSVYTYTYML